MKFAPGRPKAKMFLRDPADDQINVVVLGDEHAMDRQCPARQRTELPECVSGAGDVDVP